ncbi:MAG: copper chaperone PCu(A)C [Leptospira sp.]|nr:copper chaperone PCu(A)C [Leptospira sp.]
MKKLYLIFVLILTTIHCGDESHSDKKGIEIQGAWVRLVPKSSNVTGAYIQITNHGELDRLQAARSDIAETVEIHEMKETEGMMQMRKLEQGIELPSHKRIRLLPGGNHLMLIGLKKELKPGMKVPIVLEFAKSAPLSVEFTVGEMGEPISDSHNHDHNH